MKKFPKINFTIIILVIASCTLAPKYKRPDANVPFAKGDKEKTEINLISWQEFFQSQDLQRVIELALKNNYDLKVANINIKSAEANHAIARANLFPTVLASGLRTRQQAPTAFKSFTPKIQYRANLNVTSFEVDFFGRLQSLKKAALEQFLASKAAHDAMKISIIAETVNSYAQLIADSATLEIAKLNLELQNEKYDLVNAKYEVGSASKADQITALSDRENSKINYENYRKLVESDKHDLMVLCGSFDEKNLPQITSLHEIKINESALSFVASKALLSRPDIQEAEHSLKSANANIGAARAAFFPSITLTGNDGYASTGNMQSLIAPSQKSWTFTPQINLPIFSGGRNFATLKLSKAQKEAAIAEYQKAIQTAFREALDELENRKSIVEQLQSAEEILKARKDFFKISKARNEVGITSKSDLIDDRILFLAAKQNELGTRKEYIANLVNLYKVLGGGSELERED